MAPDAGEGAGEFVVVQVQVHEVRGASYAWNGALQRIILEI